MGEHISARWGWDELYVHKERWSEKPWYIVMLGKQQIGTVSIHEHSDFTRFGEFYLLSSFRRQGIGTMVLSDFLKGCDRTKHPVRLEYLKWNPAGSLYKRHGFEVIAENDIHYFMVRELR